MLRKQKTFIAILMLSFIVACTSKMPVDVNFTAKVDSILDKSNDYLNSGSVKQAVIYLDSAYAGINRPGTLDLWKKYNFLRNFYLNYEISIAKAGLYTDSMFNILKDKDEKYKDEYAQTIFAKGDLLRAQGKYNEAFENYYRGRLFALKNLDTCQLMSFTNRLGLIRYTQKDFLKAVTYFKQALKEGTFCGTSTTFEKRFIIPQSIYNNIGLSYEQSNMPDSAIAYYKEGLTFIDREAQRYPARHNYIEMSKGVIYGNLGGLYRQLKQYEDAAHYMVMSIAINDRPGFAREDAGTAKNKLALMYLETGSAEKAGRLIDQLETDMKKREGRNEELVRAYRSLYRLKSLYLEKKGDLINAYRYLRKYNKIGDSLAISDSKAASVDMDAVFKQSEQEHRLQLMRRDNSMKTFYLVAVTVISIMVASILAIVWYNLRRSRKNVLQLRLLNDQVIFQNGQLRETMEALEQSQAENNRMMKVVAHDLRNPMGSIHMIASLMLHRSKLSTEDQELAEMMKRSSKNCLDLVDDLMRPKAMDQPFAVQREELSEVLRFCVDQLKLKAKDKRQELVLEVQKMEVPINTEKFCRVMSNLIGNAIKFSPEDKTIVVKLMQKDDHALISVTDHGIGIPEELKQSVFEVPDKVRRVGTAGEQSFGLGLAISRQIVMLHGGRIWFEDTPGGGTTFYIGLPLNEGD